MSLVIPVLSVQEVLSRSVNRVFSILTAAAATAALLSSPSRSLSSSPLPVGISCVQRKTTEGKTN